MARYPAPKNYCSFKMKTGVIRRSFYAGLAAFGAFALSACGQVPGGAGPAGVSAALAKLFGSTTAFSAKGEMQLSDSAGHDIGFWPMDFSLLDRRIRVEIDLTRARTKNMPDGMAAMLKQIGMAEVVSIIRPDKGVVYVMYPDQRMLLKMPLPKEELEATDQSVKISKKKLGKETINGHPCVKNRVTVTDGSGKTVEATTWEASDLKDLPIQIETQEADSVSTVRFNQVDFARPAEAYFEPPSGFTQYDNPNDLKLAVMKKMVDNAAKK